LVDSGKIPIFVAIIFIAMLIDNIKTHVVSVDIRLETTTIAVVDVRGNITATSEFHTLEYQQVGDYLAALSNSILNLVERNGGYEIIRSIGISVPSGNFYTGCIENSPNFPWKGVVPMAAMLRDRIGLAVALGNNSHVAAMGEWAFGTAHGMKDFVLLTMESGLGSCIVCNGQVYNGANGFAGEIGHTCVVPDGRQCGCGKKGCLETYATIRGINKTAKEVLAESDKPSALRQLDSFTVNAIATFCEQGDEVALETLRRTGKILGLGLANYASVLNPEAFVFADDLKTLGRWILPAAYEAFQDHVFHNIADKVKFVVSSLDDQTRALLGASVLAWEVKEYSLFK